MGIYLLVTALFVFVFITISVILNVIVHITLKSKKDNNRVRSESVMRNIHQKEATSTLLILSVMLSVCYFPNALSFSVIGYNIISDNIEKSSSYRQYTPWTHYLVLLNSGFNSFAYILRTKTIHEFYAKHLCGISPMKIENTQPLLLEQSPHIHSRNYHTSAGTH